MRIFICCFVILLLSCSSSHYSKGEATDDSAESFTEICKRCKKTVHKFSYSWTKKDYEFLTAVFPDETFRIKSPYGPHPTCESTYERDLSFKYLKEEMPLLKKETFESFLKKNKSIAVHSSGNLPIKTSKENGLKLSRPGFSTDSKQVLICDGKGIGLYIFKQGKWELEGSVILWI